jgi:hypothetical protein
LLFFSASKPVRFFSLPFCFINFFHKWFSDVCIVVQKGCEPASEQLGLCEEEEEEEQEHPNFIIKLLLLYLFVHNSNPW